jgi:SAM-dependent methyltransferase
MSHAVERHCDVCVTGASAADLSAALLVARRRRSVIVLDAGEHPGTDAEREQVRSHGGEILAARAERVTSGDDGLTRIELAGGNAVVARRVLAAGTDLHGAEAVCAALDEDDRQTGAVPANQADWDHRYGRGQMWSGNPNGTLVAEVGGVTPGRALDVGAGEGGDAIWLAERGWQVTAADISPRALERIAAEADRRGLRIACLRADANATDPFPAGAFDLVSAQYASIPRTADDRAVQNILGAVAAGGTLLVVSHDLASMRTPVDTHVQSRPFDPDAYVRVDDFAAALAESPEWDVELHEQRPRPPGAATSHHVDDVVLRARRHAAG